MNIAFCVYGQPRTWKLCLPRTLYQLTELQALGHTVHLFMHLKNYNSYVNVDNKHREVQMLEESELDHIESACVKKNFDIKVRYARREEDKKFETTNSWHYCSMFRSMQNVLDLAWYKSSKEHLNYDMVFLGRMDLIYKDLKSLVEHALLPLSIYSKSPNIRFPNEAHLLGFHDYFFYGDAMSMDLLVSGTYNLTISNPCERSTALLWPMGPNVVLKRIADRSSLRIYHCQLDAAIVRPNADPMGDYEYHHKFWTENHPALLKPINLG